MSSYVSRASLVSLCLGALLAAGCGGSNGLGNTIGGNFGAQGATRLIDASEQSGGPFTLTADGIVINSGIDPGVQIGNYALVNAGTHNFSVQPGGQNTNTSVAASTNYSEVLEGEPGSSNYQLFGFRDANPLLYSNLFRVKINDAAPDIRGPVDFYLWPVGSAVPFSPLVAGLTLNTDSGTVAGAPGDSYVPRSTDPAPAAMFQVSGDFNLAVVPSGLRPNASTDLLEATGQLDVGSDYSFTLEDAAAGSFNSMDVLVSIDAPQIGGNQSSLSVKRHKI